MNYVLDRVLRDCDEHELIALCEQLTFLVEGGYEFDSESDRSKHETRLAEVLDAVDGRIRQFHLFECLEDLS